ncbi:MAG: hypothetical protein H6751_13735 [Candidatus Omnitrophica bacterium]|nr:hypothetical protein [Candidatus Omnitrophota bacterium]
MNRSNLPIFLIGFILFQLSGPIHAKTNPLSPGDVAIIGIHADDLDGAASNDNKDGFAWVNLVPLDAGTILYFTDEGWRSTNEFAKLEGALKYTAPSSIPAGTVFQIDFDDAPAGPFTTSDSGAIGGTYVDAADANVGGAVLEFPTGLSRGDNLFIFDGTTASPNFLFAYKPNGPYQFDSTQANTTALPSTLTDGETAVSTPFTLFAFDNLRYEGVTTGPRSMILAGITNELNWYGNSTGPVDFGGAITTSPTELWVRVSRSLLPRGQRDRKDRLPRGDTGSTNITFTANHRET